MYSTFFGECSSLKKRSYLSQWGFKHHNSKHYIYSILIVCVFFKKYRFITSWMLTKHFRPELFHDSDLIRITNILTSNCLNSYFSSASRHVKQNKYKIHELKSICNCVYFVLLFVCMY